MGRKQTAALELRNCCPNFRILLVLIAVCSGLVLTACQSATSVSSEKQTPQSPKDRAVAAYSNAFCDVVDRLEAMRRSRGEAPLENGDCEWLRATGSVEGYQHTTRGGLVGLPENLKAIANYSRARKAVVPSDITSEGEEAVDLYRKMMIRGYDQNDVDRVARTNIFAKATALWKRARRLSGE